MAFFLLPYIKLFKKTNRITAHSRKSPYLGPPWIVSINYWYILIVYATVHYTTVQYTTIPRSAQSRVKKKKLNAKHWLPGENFLRQKVFIL